LNLGRCCDKLKLQERRISDLAVKYEASKLKIDMTGTELAFLNSVDNRAFVPLE
jgi:hypothetical protein